MERIRRHGAGLTLLVLAWLLVAVPVPGKVTASTGALDRKVPGKVDARARANTPKPVPLSGTDTRTSMDTGTSGTATGTTQAGPQENIITARDTNTGGWGMIEVWKCNDVDGDGNIGTGDALFASPSVTFELYRGSTLMATKATREGKGDLNTIPLGSRMGNEEAPAGWTNTTGVSQTWTSDSQNPAGSPDLGNSQDPKPGQQQWRLIKALKYDDLDANGAWDNPTVDGPLASNPVTFNLYRGGVLFDTEATQGGPAIFWKMPLGDYVLKEAVPAGWSATTSTTRDIALSQPNAIHSEIFGNTQMSGLRAFKFLDVNGDGIRNSGDGGLAGVTIVVSRDGTPVGNQVTDSQGDANFIGLAPGPYTVQEIVPTGYKATTSASINVTVEQGQQAYAEFGNTAMAAITGFEFGDTNGDGIRQAGEPGLAGIIIELWEGTLKVGQMTTGVDGAFAFDSLNSTTYTVKELGTAGYVATTPTSQNVTLTAQAPHGYVEFGNTRLATIRGTKWIDANGNGILDEGEMGASNIAIQLFNANAQTQAMAMTTTGAVGTYSFQNLRPGTYIVKEIGVAGMRAVWPESVTVVLNAGDSLNVDFMNTPMASISGTKWDDLNADGKHQPDEPPLAGVTITLSGAGTGSIVTDANGKYSFNALAPGSYTVAEQVPANMEATSPASVNMTLAAGQNAVVDFLNKSAKPVRPEGGSGDVALPRTGTNLKLPLMLALVVVLVGAVIIGIGVWKRRFRQR